jgi:hypothetical protein
VAESPPQVGSARWQEWAERLMDENEELHERNRTLQREIAKLKSGATSEAMNRVVEAEAELAKVTEAAHSMCGVVESIVNRPDMNREDVQRRLLLVVQNLGPKLGRGG